MEKYYYELSFYGEKPTRESLKDYGDFGFTWYIKSSEPLTLKQAIEKCVNEHKNVSNYWELIRAIPYCDGISQISGDEFESCCGISK